MDGAQAPGGTELDVSAGALATQPRRRRPAARRRPPGRLAPPRHRGAGPRRGGAWSTRSTRRARRDRGGRASRRSWPTAVRGRVRVRGDSRHPGVAASRPRRAGCGGDDEGAPIPADAAPSSSAQLDGGRPDRERQRGRLRRRDPGQRGATTSPTSTRRIDRASGEGRRGRAGRAAAGASTASSTGERALRRAARRTSTRRPRPRRRHDDRPRRRRRRPTPTTTDADGDHSRPTTATTPTTPDRPRPRRTRAVGRRRTAAARGAPGEATE